MQATKIGRATMLFLCTLAIAGAARGSGGGLEAEFAALSPNHELRIVVTPPARASNQLQRRMSADRRLTLTLYDELSDEVIWTREHTVGSAIDWSGRRAMGAASGRRAGSRPRVWLDDVGHVVLTSGADTMTVFHPDDGEVVLEFDLLRCFPPEDHEAFMRPSKSGPLWAANSRWFFLDIDDSWGAGGTGRYFVVRPWWERHVVIDLDAGEVVRLEGMPNTDFLAEIDESRSREILAAIDREDRAWVMETLRLGADFRTRYYHAVPTAAHMAGRLDMEEAVPWLRLFEGAEYVGVKSDTRREFTLRQTVQLSLRRLGAETGDFAVTELGDFSDDMPRPIKRAASRIHRVWNVREVREGMTVKDLVGLIGHPDYIAFPRGRVLDYDIDRGGEPFTFRVTLVDVDDDDDHDSIDLRVGAVERITPPIWQDSNERDVAVTNRRFGPADPSRRTMETDGR
jgi:hypothetical protein